MNAVRNSASGCEIVPHALCLMPDPPEAWNCELCQSIAEWVEAGFDCLYIRIPQKAKNLAYIFPGKTSEPRPSDCLFVIGLAAQDDEEARRLLNTNLVVADEIWLWADSPARSVRVR